MATDCEIRIKTNNFEDVTTDKLITLLSDLQEKGYLNLKGDLSIYKDEFNEELKPENINEVKAFISSLEPKDYFFKISHAGIDGDKIEHNKISDVVNEIIDASCECSEENDELTCMSIYSIYLSISEDSIPEADYHQKFFALKFSGDGLLDENAIKNKLSNKISYNELLSILESNLSLKMEFEHFLEW